MISFSNKNVKMTSGYIILMTIVYYTYVLLERHRLNKSFYLSAKNDITPEEFASIKQLGTWISTFEIIFFVSFLITFTVIYIHNRKNTKILMHFLLFNTVLFIGIALMNYIISLVSSMPIGNLMQPLIWPTLVIIVLFIYVLLLRVKK